MIDALVDEIKDIAERSHAGASEREIETDLVQVFRNIGWPRAQIKQDVPVSDRAADKVDIILNLGDNPALLVEVKKHGLTRDAEGQLRRYCALRRPLLALLTDGVRWVIYYVGQREITPLTDDTSETMLASFAGTLGSIRPERLSALIKAGAFEYLAIIEEGLQKLSDDGKRRLLPHFVSTAITLLVSSEHLSRASTHTEPAPHDTVFSDGRTELEKQPLQKNEVTGKNYDPLQPPDLSHTSIIHAQFGQQKASRWRALVKAGIAAAVSAGYTKPDIERIIKANVKDGVFTEQGYNIVSGTNISYQGQSAKDAWQDALQLAKALKYEIEVLFCWQDKEQSQHPGEQGRLYWSP